MTHDDAFLEDIGANPDDDTPRLVYADWLDDHGQSERAEFIRVQCERARVPRDDPRVLWLRCKCPFAYPAGLPHLFPEMPRLAGLLRRERELHAGHAASWRAALPELKGVSWGAFERGFVGRARVTDVGMFLKHAGAVFAASPGGKVAFSQLDPRAPAELFASPHVGRIRSLGMSELALTPAFAGALAASPHAAGLTSLDLSGNPNLALMAAKALADSPYLSRLRALDLSGCRVNGKGVAALLGSPRLAGLSDLFLSNNALAPADVAALSPLAGLARLGALDLSRNALGTGSGFSQWTNFSRLTTLSLFDARLLDADVEQLAAAPALASVAALDLGVNGVTAVGARALARSPFAASLRALVLDDNRVGDAGATALAASPRLTGLTVLGLDNNGVGPDGVAALARSPHLANLVALDLSKNGVTDAAALALTESRSLGRLRVLVLSGNPFGKRAAGALRRRFGDGLW